MSDPLKLRVMNTRTHRLEPFAPNQPGVVRMYVCGPSVYDESHLGHARSYVTYDAMKRYFRAHDLRVVHVQNFTDVEEHIAERAAEAGKEPLEYAETLIEHFFRDMDALHVLRADHYPRVSEHLDEIIRTVRALEEKGVAYRYDCGPREHTAASACDVYFDAQAVDDYGALIGTDIDELVVERPMQQGERRHPLDFALWKSRDDWGITWDSPWGTGRPGWHVECTSMAMKYLGADFDIHGGGLDLVFPHHENERVIGEAVSGGRYCNHYLHNGFVTVQSQKMSKSMGNFVTIRQLLSEHDPEVLRTFLLSQHYRAPLNYDEGAIREAGARVRNWRRAVERLLKEAGNVQEVADAARLPDAVAKEVAAFWDALADDFHFDHAQESLDRALKASEGLTGAEAAAMLAFLHRAADATGLIWSVPKRAQSS